MAINSKVSTLSTQASGGEEIVRITVRKGNEADFLPSEMLPGELAISTDKGIARYCYSAGKIKVFATREDIYEILGASAEEFEKFQELIEYLKQNQNVYDEIIANLNSLEENKQDNLIVSLSGASEYVSEAHDGAGIIRKFPGKTLQDGTPSPENPVRVQGVGDSGYFDGELVQGGYSTTDGTLKDYKDFVSNKNYISCKEGDQVNVIVDGEEGAESAIFFYQENGTFISYIMGMKGTAPSKTSYVNFRYNKSGITPQSTGHITVTINGKYAAIAKSVGKNLFENNWRIGDWNNTTTSIRASTNQKIFLKNGESVTFSINKNSGFLYSIAQLDENLIYKSAIGFRTENYTLKASYDQYLVPVLRNESNDTITLDDTKEVKMQVEYGESATEFIPYKSSEARIPLSQTMYDGDYVYIKDGELWVHRENGVVVFDGSEDEDWIYYGESGGNPIGLFGINVLSIGFRNQFSPLCNYFMQSENPKIYQNNYCGIDGYNNFWVVIGSIDNLNDFKTWLSDHNLIVLSALSTPIEEKITSAEPYTLRAYTPQTRIWTPDELEPEIEVDIPKNLAGSYATDGYAQAMKNQAATAEQEAIKARLLSLEQLAIKEV